MTAKPRRRMSRTARRILIAVAVIVALNLATAAYGRWSDPIVTGSHGSSEATAPSGIAGWHDVLSELGTTTSRSGLRPSERIPAPGNVLVAMVPGRRYAADDAAALRTFVTSGGRLITTSEVGSQLLGGITSDARGQSGVGVLASPGTIDRVERLDLATRRLRHASGSPMVVDAAGRAAVISGTLGDGDIVVLGDWGMLTNERLGNADNAVLAVRLT